jgi:hypothetical protein
MKYQRGVALSGLIFWGVIFFLVAVLGMKVAPTTIEYYKILKNTKAWLHPRLLRRQRWQMSDVPSTSTQNVDHLVEFQAKPTGYF